ncbi:hypothetical protein [Allokutzneria sp. NRRL B-24872]|uniref:hypothetical protein n=1 Tax=Allokutzneria sp. NRRL B-24872 TaxID=1137961 RepID=UPI001177EE1B|nr:hypothetical protein [Allokutzneria sp. NRRL B-24872]
MFQRRSRRGRRAVVGALALALLATGCSGEPAAAPPSDKSPAQGGGAPAASAPTMDFGSAQATPDVVKSLAEAAIYRTWDPCALHDPTSAAKIFNDVVALIEPSDFSSCLMTIKLDRNGSRSWRIYTRVDSRFDEDAAGEVVEAAGRKFVQDKKSSSSSPGCEYNMQTSKTKALSLQVSWSGSLSSDPPPKDPCALAKEYITALAPFFANPPLRSEKATEPQLPLASKDPCAPVKELAEKFKSLGAGEQPRVSTGLSANDCNLNFSSKPVPGQRTRPEISIGYKWSIDPAEGIAGGGTARKTQIEGKPALVNERPTGSIGCIVTVQYDPLEVPEVDRVQVVQVGAPDCQTAEEAAKIATKAAL